MWQNDFCVWCAVLFAALKSSWFLQYHCGFFVHLVSINFFSFFLLISKTIRCADYYWVVIFGEYCWSNGIENELIKYCLCCDDQHFSWSGCFHFVLFPFVQPLHKSISFNGYLFRLNKITLIKDIHKSIFTNRAQTACMISAVAQSITNRKTLYNVIFAFVIEFNGIFAATMIVMNLCCSTPFSYPQNVLHDGIWFLC